MNVDVTDLPATTSKVIQLARERCGSYVCVSNVHMCMEVFDSPAFADQVNGANLVIPDGRPIYWAQRILGARAAKQVRGLDVMAALCRQSAESQLKIGLYGGSSEALVAEVRRHLEASYPGVDVAYVYSPPFRALTETEDNVVVTAIETSGVDILFVGIGCPKQEKWMAAHVDRLGCVMLGVGAAFDFIIGAKRHAPRWMQVLGLEWVFRLLSEPRRLWKRYLTTNPRFCWYFLQQLAFGRSWLKS